MLAPEVQPGPHQVMALSMGWMFSPLFATPAEARSLSHSYVRWSNGDTVICSRSQQQGTGGIRNPTLGLGAQDLNKRTKLLHPDRQITA